ncbi:TPA: hypothetical protein NIK00_006441 [Pseudomonas aeruginosa]|nr:hypothetical protein [Pseudomonas aeruginosa]
MSLRQLMKSVPARVGVAAGAVVAAGAASAADAIDVSAIVSQISAGVVAVTAVCTAGLGVVVVVKVFRYVRSAM